MTVRFERIAVIGLGLLGGSVAGAAKRAGVADTVVGASRSREARETALARGWVDETAAPAAVVRDADLVVLATPIYVMADMLRAVAPELSPGCVVTDVGSVKAPLVDTLPGLLPSGVPYVGSHPMAGSHENGIQHARANLFEGSVCVVTEGPAEARGRVCAFWESVGARVVRRDAADHDAEVAWTSHVPHVLAFAFAAAFGDAPDGARDVVGSGFRDFTRIARSDSELWSDILTGNRKAMGAPLARVGEALAELGRAVEANDGESVERWIATAREALALVRHPDSARGEAAGRQTGETDSDED